MSKFDKSTKLLTALRKELNHMANHTEDLTRKTWLLESCALLDEPIRLLQVAANMQEALAEFVKEDVTT